ncbi:lipid-A-disaccharide synthase [uncultured Cytophaga sp.]|uniref:lipid-A-disaccharide synthase n=1 Tax=uncultured Cytophaga sp. TaxID=160238 RepID=UPI00262B21D1|nr:lipid-A-disaccharide synthase [uncultured Cytophaga sp.]
MKYYLICGERSGDLHASNLIKAIKAQDPEIKMRGIGGDLSKAAGLKLHAHYKDIAFMGIMEVLFNILTIAKVLNATKKDIQEYKPDAMILVDFSGFNMKIAAFCKEQNIKVFYYISPKVWAWNTKRAHKIKRLVDHMFVILPFEKEFYEKFNYKVDYVGNPLRDAIAQFKPDGNFLQKHQLNLEKKLVAILPGSRYQEVTMLLDRMVEVAFDFPQVQFVIAAVSNLDSAIYEPYKRNNVRIVTDETYDLLLHSRAAVVASGTATLETCLFNVPQVVCYRLNSISYSIAKMVLSVKYISLVNLIVDKPVVKELIQGECTIKNIRKELEHLIHDSNARNIMLAGYQEVSDRIGETGVSQKTASLIASYMKPEEV